MPTTTKSATAVEPAASAQASGELIVAAGHAVAPLLPSTELLVPGVPQPAALAVSTEWAGAAVARLDGSEDALVGVLVGAGLVEALASSPFGELDLAAAVQPALDAAAAVFGATAGAGETVDPANVGATLSPEATVLPLLADGVTMAQLLVVPPAPKPVVTPDRSVAEPAYRPGIELLHGVAMEVTVELGRTRMSVRELLALSPGDVLELDRAAGSPADLLVNGRLIARGEVVVVDENFALRVTEIVSSASAS